MKANEYNILDRCVSEGVAMGLSRAYKHTDTPDKHTIENCVHDAVMHEILEYFSLEMYENYDYDGTEEF